ncbi:MULTISPECIES: ribonuclease toxin immunity protein CdiI [Photorhabdus]|uniref:ribonuclease toxin immunity protein CdiI n=1 Tax=Photorhabdus TaxID=29487 RepID=UPI002105F754|nr:MULTISPECIES: ribonuclease toxin immunity protein CdiI [Photorhabdus]
MSNKRLFEKIDYNSDSEWVMKEFFNSIYSQGEFLWALPLVLKKDGCGVNETYCIFPNLDDPDPEIPF